MKKINVTKLKLSKTYPAECLERKIERLISNKEPIGEGAALIYTERKDGVLPEYDIRTDRFDVAVGGMDKVSKSHKAKRDERHKTKEDDTKGTDKSTEVGNNRDNAGKGTDTLK